jgi:putative membrane protein
MGRASWGSLMVRNILFTVVIFAGLLLATVFAALNPGLTTLDLAYQEVQVPKSLALAVAFGVGWVFGLLCAGIILVKSVGERRKLRRSLQIADAEVKTLRSMPIHDAD